jgi:hypothetical protein
MGVYSTSSFLTRRHIVLSLEEQFNNGLHERYDVQDIGLTFLGGVYLRMSIPAAALGG